MKSTGKISFLLLIISAINCSCEKTDVRLTGKTVVVNELMPVNSTVASDQDGEYDDWIELFNPTSSAIDISGYFLTDNNDKPDKWVIPQGTTLAAKGYLIIWADKDTLQSGYHANFKLSAEGEKVLFSTPEGTIINKIDYPAQNRELSFSRVPDGTGEFSWQSATYNSSNIANK